MLTISYSFTDLTFYCDAIINNIKQSRATTRDTLLYLALSINNVWTLYIQLTATSQKELEDIKGVIRIVYRSEEQKTRRSKIMWGVNL